MKVYYINKLNGNSYYLTKFNKETFEATLEWSDQRKLTISSQELNQNYIKVSTETFDKLEAALKKARENRANYFLNVVETLDNTTDDTDWDWELDEEDKDIKPTCIIGGLKVKVSLNYLSEFMEDNKEVIQIRHLNTRRGPIRESDDWTYIPVKRESTWYDSDYQVSWNEEDKEWVATHKNYPSLNWLDADRDKALLGLNKLIEEIDV